MGARRHLVTGDAPLAEGGSWLHADHLGTTRLATGAGGAVSARLDYDAWGAGKDSSSGPGLSGVRRRYTDQPAEPRLGLQYHHARWYAPGLGAFVSPDPAFDFPENFGNPYSYVGSSPAGRIDRTGLFSMTEMNAAASIASDLRVQVFADVPEIMMMVMGNLAADADTSIIFNPIFQMIAEKTNFLEIAARIGRIVDENPEAIEGAMAVAELLSIVQTAVQVIEISLAVIRAVLSRSFRDIFTALQSVMGLFQQFGSSQLDIKLQYNGLFHRIIPPGWVYPEWIQLHHIMSDKFTGGRKIDWTASFRSMLTGAGVGDYDLDNPGNKVTAQHCGSHPDKYHDWVHKTVNRRLDYVKKKNGKVTHLDVDFILRAIGNRVQKMPWLLRRAGWIYP